MQRVAQPTLRRKRRSLHREHAVRLGGVAHDVEVEGYPKLLYRHYAMAGVVCQCLFDQLRELRRAL